MALGRTTDPPERVGAERSVLVLNQLHHLPPLPAAALRLIELSRSEDAEARDLIRVIESDPALTALVLRLARRAGSGIRREVTSVERIVVLVGFRAVRNTALMAVVHEAFPRRRSGADDVFPHDSFWRHSVATACAAQLLAERGGIPRRSGDAFVCGLLHDLGKLALATCFPKAYRRVVEAVDQRGTCICEAEQTVFELDHTAVGRHLASRWQLPEPIVDSVWLHHQPPEMLSALTAHSEFVQLVHVADALVRRRRIGYSGYAFLEPIEDLAAQVDLPTSVLQAVEERIEPAMTPFLDFLGEGASDRDAREMSAEAQRALNTLRQQVAERERVLRRQRRMARTIHRFVQALRAGQAMAEVCASAAAAVAEGGFGAADASGTAPASPSSGAVAFCAALPSLAGVNYHVHVGWHDGGDSPAQAEVFETGVSPSLPPLVDRVVDTLEPGRVVPAPIEGEDLWRTCVGTRPGEDSMLVILPFGGDGRVIGGILYVDHQREVRRSGARSAFETGRRRAPDRANGAHSAARPPGGGAPEPHDAPMSLLDEGRTISPGDDPAVFARLVAIACASAGAHTDALHVSNELLQANRRLREAQRTLVRARSISMIGAMAAGAAHELHNPIAVISGRAQMLLEQTDDPTIRRVLELIHTETVRASRIVMELMTFAKPRPPAPELLDLAGVLERRCQHWRDASPLDTEQLVLIAPPRGSAVYLDPGHLEEILDAIIANAIEATDPRSAHIRINSPASPSDETVRIEIEDNGIGMTRDVLEHAIDPFFSSRPAGRGRGLGLSQAYRLAEINGGRVMLESTPNVGTRVTIELPGRGARSETTPQPSPDRAAIR
jgi:putative nucleotidyltransferase with HDIG domain